MKIVQFWINLSAPILQIRLQWMLAHFRKKKLFKIYQCALLHALVLILLVVKEGFAFLAWVSIPTRQLTMSFLLQKGILISKLFLKYKARVRCVSSSLFGLPFRIPVQFYDRGSSPFTIYKWLVQKDFNNISASFQNLFVVVFT